MFMVTKKNLQIVLTLHFESKLFIPIYFYFKTINHFVKHLLILFPHLEKSEFEPQHFISSRKRPYFDVVAIISLH